MAGTKSVSDHQEDSRSERSLALFVSLKKAGARYAWDKRPGHYFIEWWEGRHRRREVAGQTPSEAMEARRRKRNELVGELVLGNPKAEIADSGGSSPSRCSPMPSRCSCSTCGCTRRTSLVR